jgi:hypothetical protein
MPYIHCYVALIIMENKRRLEQLEKWMRAHNVTKCGDKVYDGFGVVILIDKGKFDYEIRIQPLYSDHNLGSGYGSIIKVLF